jgi:membrane fusion protein, multidrug efflux system
MSYSIQFRRIAAVLAVLFLPACAQEKDVISDHIPLVKYEIATPSNEREKRTFSGVLQSNVSSSLSFRVSGKVSSVYVDRGESVNKGQLLAELDQADLRRNLEKAEADRASRQAEHNEQQLVVTRNTELLKAGTISRVQGENDATRLEATGNNLRIAELNVENARRDLENTRLIAPFDGVIITRDLDPYVEVTSGKQAFELNSPTSLQVKVLVPETIIRRISYGQDVEISFPTVQGIVVAGTVSQIGADVEVGNAFEVVVTLEPTDFDLRIGMSASTSFIFPQEKRDVFTVPVSAFAQGDLNLGDPDLTEHFLLLINPETGILERREVKPDGVIGGRVRVVEGLQKGDIYAVAGVPFLREGTLVQLWEPSK